MIASRAALKVINTALLQNGTWGTRVRRDMAEVGLARPFVVMTLIGGAATYQSQKRPETLRVRVMVVAENQSDADTGAYQVERALNLLGTQQPERTGFLDASVDGFEVLLVRKGNAFQPAVELDENREIYRAGADYDVLLERIANGYV